MGKEAIGFSVGEITDRLGKKIFSENERKSYIEREKILKKYIDLVLIQCVQIVTLSNKEESFYNKARIKDSLKRLVDYVYYLTNELDRKKIMAFCDKQKFLNLNYDIDIPFLIGNSYFGNIKYDLYWIPDLKLYDTLAIARGDFDIEDLSKYLPDTFEEIKILIAKVIHKNPFYEVYHNTIAEIEKCYTANLLKACNLLILTLIEGIVRKLGKYLIEKQGIEIDKKGNYNSLDSFLRKIPWKRDFKVLNSEYNRLNAKFDFVNMHEKSFKEVEISLKERLDFLRRRFKENRDLILHGQENDYGKKWQTFINFKALEQVFITVEYYQKKYEI